MEKIVEETDPLNIRTRATDLECTEPTRFSFVPYGMEDAEKKDDLSLSDEAISLRKVLEKEGFDETPIDEGEELKTYSQKGSELFIGTIFISYALLEQDWETTIAILQTIEDYCSAVRGADRVRMRINTEDADGESREVLYEGPADELDDALDKAKELVNDDE